MPRQLLAIACVAAALLLQISLAGCFSSSSAEGQYRESRDSGRVQAYDEAGRNDGIHLMRLRIVQFDEDAGGIVELFHVNEYRNFESQPTVITAPEPGYWCTRFVDGTVRDDQVNFQFSDALNRIWQVSGTLEQSGDTLSARLERVAADGDIVPGPNALMPEDQLYFAEGGQPDKQLVLERISADVGQQELGCPTYQGRDEITLVLPGEPPPNYRVAMVLTQAIPGLTTDEPLAGIGAFEVMTATLDAGIDLLEGQERKLVINMVPVREQLADVQAGIAVGTFVVYGDLETDQHPRDDRWQNLRAGNRHVEPVWAYTQRQVLVYNVNDELVRLGVKDQTGARRAEPVFDADASRRVGWSMYSYYRDNVTLPDGTPVQMVRQFIEEPTSRAELVLVEQTPESCELCYPRPPEPDELQPGVDMPDCGACPALLPLLFL